MDAATQRTDRALDAQAAFHAASCSVSGRTVLSLFDYSGNWSLPYEEAGANVVRIDIKHGVDVTAINATWLMENVMDAYGTVDAILAAPPCTDFAVSGAQYWPAKDKSGQTEKSLELVRQVLRCVEFCKPDWWAMENPVGRLNTLMPELKKLGPWYFDPCDFGDPYTKRTGLWGNYVPPLPLFVGGDRSVKPIRACSQGSWLQKLGGKSEKTKTLRSTTPMGFAYSFFLANCWGSARTLNSIIERTKSCLYTAFGFLSRRHDKKVARAWQAEKQIALEAIRRAVGFPLAGEVVFMQTRRGLTKTTCIKTTSEARHGHCGGAI